MAKLVFTQKPDSIYDDLPERHYHFPKTYLNQVKQGVGDWVIYYRPRRGSSTFGAQPASSYFALARLTDILQDQEDQGKYYALVADYLEFDESISFRREEDSYEVSLLKADGSVNKGAFGRSVRVLTDDAFSKIIEAGFASGPRSWEAVGDVAISDENNIRPLIDQVSKRYFRDRRFRLTVCDAYNNTCALTGLSLLNGGGRPEVQAAHIKPVAKQGPDSIRNGLALSSTAHWMFDRGLVTLDNEFRVVPSKALNSEMHQGLVVAGKKINLPALESQYPSQLYLSYHRENIFHD